MQESSHIRAVSLVLALLIIIGGWMLFEYGDQQNQQTLAPIEQSQGEIIPTPQQLQPNPSPAASPVNSIPNNLILTYKCEKAGRISYSDKPCATNEKPLAVMAAEKETTAPDRTLDQLRKTVATMEADRLERERKYAATLPTPTVTNSYVQARNIQCQQIDLEITAIDARLRAQHDAQTGDYWT